jgi:signal transduction histidine kinase/response regulator RpfG family c-di-GMP phosphodiesterase
MNAGVMHAVRPSNNNGSGKQRVLLVDDEPQVLVALEDLLSDEYCVLKAQSGEDALKLIRKDPEIAVVITDQRMPKMTGDEFLTRLDKHGATRILLTGYADLSAVIRAVNEGKIFAYVTKPWNAEDLWMTVHNAAEHFHLAQELNSERQRLQDKTILLDSILDCMGEGVVAADMQGKLLVYNRRAEKILGVSAASVPPDAWTERFGLHLPDQKTPVPSDQLPLSRILSGESFVEADMFVKNARVPGTAVAVTATPLTGESGELAGGIAVLRDVTQQRQLEAQLIQSQKMEAIGQLAGGVAHDFNNLLAVIMGYGELLLGEFVPEDPKGNDVGEMLNAAKRGVALTRQLLAFSRQQMVQPAILSLNEIVDGIEKMLRRIIGEHIRLSTKLATELGRFKADASQVEQILLNLTVNARDAMPEGGRMRIETRNVHLDEAAASSQPGVSAGDYVVLTVADTGTGMDEETKKRVFEPFFTTKEVGKGTGLGLSTVYGIVRQSGGHIVIQSEVGKGATFEVFFPRAEGAASARRSQAPAAPVQKATETVLIVEDDEGVRVVATRILREQGYTVLEARRASEARRIWEKHGPNIDLLLTDVVMPDINGPKLAEELAKTRPGMRVLYMSGYPGAGGLATIDGSAPHCIEKPFTPASLAAKVREMLDKGAKPAMLQ